MIILYLIQLILVLLVPGLIGALAYKLTAHLKAPIDLRVTAILDFVTFITMLIVLYFHSGVLCMKQLFCDFNCLHFTIKYALSSLLVVIIWGILFGLIRRLFCCFRK